MALGKLRGFPCSPLDAIKFWNFTAQGLLRGNTTFEGMKIVNKANYYNRREVEEYANAPDKVAILVINRGKHYIYVDSVKDDVMTVVDPLYDGFTTKINGTITGMRLYESTEIEPSEWLKDIWDKAKDKGLKLKSPMIEMDSQKILDCLLDMKLIDKPKDKINLGEFLAALEKVSIRW